MTNEKIEELKEKLNEMINQGANYEEIQKISELLDMQIIELYKENF